MAAFALPFPLPEPLGLEASDHWSGEQARLLDVAATCARTEVRLDRAVLPARGRTAAELPARRYAWRVDLLPTLLLTRYVDRVAVCRELNNRGSAQPCEEGVRSGAVDFMLWYVRYLPRPTGLSEGIVRLSEPFSLYRCLPWRLVQRSDTSQLLATIKTS